MHEVCLYYHAIAVGNDYQGIVILKSINVTPISLAQLSVRVAVALAGDDEAAAPARVCEMIGR